MKQKQSDKFIQSYKLLSEDECWYRAEKVAKHLLAAVCFKESSRVSFELTESVLLPPIGYYYSMFHMSVALCWLNPSIEKDKLVKIKHSTLQNLIDDYYIKQRILDSSYLILMKNFKEEREWLNYNFGEFDCDFFKEVEKNEEYVNNAFTICFSLLDEVCELLNHLFDIKFRIGTYIADSKGYDFIQTYLSGSEQKKVIDYLVKVGYSN